MNTKSIWPATWKDVVAKKRKERQSRTGFVRGGSEAQSEV
jgi:hypothetical protein